MLSDTMQGVIQYEYSCLTIVGIPIIRISWSYLFNGNPYSWKFDLYIEMGLSIFNDVNMHDNMETLSVLLVLPSQRAGCAKIWCFSPCYPNKLLNK